MRNSVCRSVLHVKSQLKVLGSRIIRAALRAALEKCYNASSPKSWFSPELEPAQVKTTSTLMILGSGPSVPFLMLISAQDGVLQLFCEAALDIVTQYGREVILFNAVEVMACSKTSVEQVGHAW